MENAMICDICEERESEGVYSADYAPISQCYCGECKKVNNVRPKEIAIFGWARLGENYFKPYIWEGVSYPPMVYCEGKYITAEELINGLTLDEIHKWVKSPFRLEFVLKKFLEIQNEIIKSR